MQATNTIVNSNVSIATRDKANEILRREGLTLSGYIRRCLEKLIAADHPPFNDFQPLAGHLLREIEAGGPEAEALLKRMAEITAAPSKEKAACS